MVYISRDRDGRFNCRKKIILATIAFLFVLLLCEALFTGAADDPGACENPDVTSPNSGNRCNGGSTCCTGECGFNSMHTSY